MKEPVRVAQILNRMDNGGIESVVMNYYRNIDRSKVQFDFFVYEDSTFPQRDELERLGAGIYLIPSYTRQWKYQKTLCNLFRANKYYVVHSHLSTMSIFPLFAAWVAKVPVRICHNHSTAERGEGKKTLLKYALRPFAKLFATHYFACGDKAARWMYGNRSVDAGKVTIMPNAVDTNRFRYNVKTRENLRKQLEIPIDALVIGHVGRFTYPKNHKRLLEIYKEFSGRRDDVYLLLVGDGEMYEQILEIAGKIGERILFTGSRQDANQLYSVMDVFCLPSFYEGMPVVAWEAQANGLCCIFSANVSKEAAVIPECEFLELDAKNITWCEALERAMKVTRRQREKEKPCLVPDIEEWAERLEQKYLEWNTQLE